MTLEPRILQLMPARSGQVNSPCITRLEYHGYAVQACTDFIELTQRIRAVQHSADPRLVIIIDSRCPDSYTAVAALRTMPVSPGIIALVNRDDDAAMIRLLQLGVDTCCYIDSPAELLIARVLRLLWRLDKHTSSPERKGLVSTQSKGKSWVLIDNGWVMRSPEGHRIELTTGERAFLSTLLQSPDKKATHVTLIAAVNSSCHSSYEDTQRSRLVILVSRMRRKFRQAGAPLPLKSVHNWGYMFVPRT